MNLLHRPAHKGRHVWGCVKFAVNAPLALTSVRRCSALPDGLIARRSTPARSASHKLASAEERAFFGAAGSVLAPYWLLCNRRELMFPKACISTDLRSQPILLVAG